VNKTKVVLFDILELDKHQKSLKNTFCVVLKKTIQWRQ